MQHECGLLAEDGSLCVGHLPFHGELCFDINLTTNTTKHRDKNTGNKENGCQDDDSSELDKH